MAFVFKAVQSLSSGLLVILFFVLFTACCVISVTWFSFVVLDGVPKVLGRRHASAFDLWSLQHLAVGLLIGYLLPRPTIQFGTDDFTLTHSVIKTWLYGACVVVPAMSWELWEYYAEAGYFGDIVKQWFGGNHEHSANRFYADPTLVYLGAMTASWFPKLKCWAYAFVPSWILINLLMPSSVTIQQFILG